MSMTLENLIEELFAVKTRPEHNTVTVSHTAPTTLVAPNNPNRLSLIISNPSSRSICVSFERDFTYPHGILLVPNGGYVSFLWSEDFNSVGWNMYGIATVGAGDLEIMEIISI